MKNIGDVITWRSQASGVVKVKTGKIVAIVRKNENLFKFLPVDVPRSRIKAQQYNMVSDRYVVEVPRMSGTIDYYVVPVGWIEKGESA